MSRHTRVAGAAAIVVAAGLLSSALYAVVVAVAGAAGWWLWTRPWRPAVRAVAAVLAVNVVFATTAVPFRRPARQVAMTVKVSAALPVADPAATVDGSVVTAADPGDWQGWLALAATDEAGGSYGDAAAPLERAVSLGGDDQAKLALALNYLHRGLGSDPTGELGDDEIAAYLTSLAHRPAPPDPRHP